MKSLSTILTALAGAFFLGTPSATDIVEVGDPESKKLHSVHVPRPRMRDRPVVDTIPDDPNLPVLQAIKSLAPRDALPFLDLGSGEVQVTLLGYSAGRRATFDVRSADRHVAVKAYAEPPEAEAQLYAALGGGSAGVHVPRLVGWNRECCVLGIEWLEGAPLTGLLRQGQGRRAGELAAKWLKYSHELPYYLGPHLKPDAWVTKAYKWADGLGSVDPEFGTVATIVANRLVASPPSHTVSQIVHGSLYHRHIFDMGDGPGLIDWDCYGQGPIELDAAVFLSTMWRAGLHTDLRDASLEAMQAFRSCTADLLDEHALSWYQAATMLRFAQKKAGRSEDDARDSMQQLLAEAERLAASV